MPASAGVFYIQRSVYKKRMSPKEAHARAKIKKPLEVALRADMSFAKPCQTYWHILRAAIPNLSDG